MTLVVLIAAWIAGLLIGLDMNVSPAALALFSLAALILTGLLRSKGLSAWPGLLVLALLLGLLRVEVSDGPRPLDSFDNLQPVTVLGRVVTDPEVSGPAVEFVISVDAVDRGGGREDGGARLQVFARPPRELVRTRVQPYFRYGDTLELVGRLETPPALGDFDYRKYLASQGIHFTMSFPEEVRLIDEDEGSAALAAVYGLRHELSRGIDRALPEPQASLAQALLLGLRGRLPQDVTEDFRSTGTSHLLAISGLHVGVLLATALGAGVWLMGRRRQLYLLLPLGAIWFYALVSGLSPSVERAAIMGSVYLVALALGRPRSILPALALAAGVMAGVEPQVLKQVSFQLSFTAVAGIALFTTFEPTLLGRFTGGFPTGGTGRWHPLVRALVLAVAVSAVATLATLPLVAFNFHRIPTLGIPATVLALPALPFVLMSSGLAAVVGLANTTAGQVIGWVAWVPLEYVIRLIDLISRVPGSNLSVPAFSGALVWAYYGAIAVLILAPGVRRLMVGPLQRLAAAWHRLASGEGVPVSRLRFPSGLYLVPLVGLSVLAAVLWFYVVTGSDGRLHVHFLDVGQGDSVLIVTPEGRQVLIDDRRRAGAHGRSSRSRWQDTLLGQEPGYGGAHPSG